jgi:hypothetical protein
MMQKPGVRSDGVTIRVPRMDTGYLRPDGQRRRKVDFRCITRPDFRGYLWGRELTTTIFGAKYVNVLYKVLE